VLQEEDGITDETGRVPQMQNERKLVSTHEFHFIVVSHWETDGIGDERGI
jgi:hypothetical protein